MDTVVSKLPDGAVLTLFCGFRLGKKCYYNIEKENAEVCKFTAILIHRTCYDSTSQEKLTVNIDLTKNRLHLWKKK